MGNDLPPGFEVDPAVLFTWQYVSTAIGILLFLWTLYFAFAKRDSLPLLMFIGGLLLSLNDPLYNSLFHIRYAENFPDAFVGFGIATPAFMPLAYAGFSIVGYFVYRSFRAGVSIRKVMSFWALIFVVDIIFEGIASSLGAFTFDGNQPFEILGWGFYLAWLNAIGFMSIGALLLFMVPRLPGWQKLFLIAVPILCHLGGVFASGWPLMIALNWDVSAPVAWLLGVVSLALSLVFAWSIVALANPSSDAEHQHLPDLKNLKIPSGGDIQAVRGG
ncbi:hypothetical protein CJ179_36320 [Rhodococcus sp. ACS1]|nr:hypothetical protein CJ179_36320 [Rhodococcus sp. ACS1]